MIFTKPVPPLDPQVIADYRSGDAARQRRAMESFWAAYEPFILYRLGSHYLSTIPEADRNWLGFESMRRALRSYDAERLGEGNFRGFLSIVVRRCAISYMRSKHFRRWHDETHQFPDDEPNKSRHRFDIERRNFHDKPSDDPLAILERENYTAHLLRLLKVQTTEMEWFAVRGMLDGKTYPMIADDWNATHRNKIAIKNVDNAVQRVRSKAAALVKDGQLSAPFGASRGNSRFARAGAANRARRYLPAAEVEALRVRDTAKAFAVADSGGKTSAWSRLTPEQRERYLISAKARRLYKAAKAREAAQRKPPSG